MIRRHGKGVRRRRWQELRDRRRQGIYLLPSLLTTANLFCGFFALLLTVENQYKEAALAISGKITDALDAPLQNAIVEIQSKDHTSVIAMTNADGDYLMVLTPGEYQLIPSFNLSEEFSASARKRLDAAFNPPYTRLTLTNQDQTGVNFVGEISD